MRLIVAATLAAALVAPLPARSCDHDKASATASAHDCAAKCPHAGAATAASRRSTADDAVLPAVQREDVVLASDTAGSGCPHARSASAQAHAGCNHAAPAAMKAEGHGDCPFARAAALKAKLDAGGAEGRELRASGKVVCARCELHQAASCKSVFQPADTQATYPLCDEAMTEQMLKLTRHGELQLTVHGRVSRTEAGEETLCVDGFSVGTI